jgi:hypothetical protein
MHIGKDMYDIKDLLRISAFLNKENFSVSDKEEPSDRL